MAYPFTSYQNPYQQSYFPYPQQMIQQQPQQNYSPIVNQSGIIWISGESEAAMYPVAPNNAVALWTKDGKTIYLKSADATGKPSMKVYDLVERTETASDGASSSDVKTPTYATKDELSAVVGVVKGFDALIASMKSDIEKMSGDLYGIAGKKRVKKAEAEEDE